MLVPLRTARASGPPSQPADWRARDAVLAKQVRLPVNAGAPVQGEPPCACGGAWRYELVPGARRPLWRCLHCGNLYRETRLLPEDTLEPPG